MKELYPDADDVLGLNIGGDEFPRMQPDMAYEQKLNTPEHRAKIEAMTNEWALKRWGAPVRQNPATLDDVTNMVCADILGSLVV